MSTSTTNTAANEDTRLHLNAEQLYSRPGLLALDAEFLRWLAAEDHALADAVLAAREHRPPAAEESDLWLALAPRVDDFLAGMFGVEGDVQALRQAQGDLAVLFEVRRRFVQRRATKARTTTEIPADGMVLLEALESRLGQPFTELAYARAVANWLADETAHSESLRMAADLACWATQTDDGRRRFRDGVLFRLPAKRDPLRRIETAAREEHGVRWLRLEDEVSARNRDGFNLTDRGCDLAGGLAEINYCIFCHHQEKDSCSRGLRGPAGAFQKNTLGVAQTGCPLGERISEMHEARQRGFVLSALAIACVDNPMLAGTGHRICNDCMVACIYQNQNRDPVDVPQAESRILKDVLAFPWGLEIYSLLTRWNPFNFDRPLPRPATGRSVLVVGLGPAGYTLAHHLLNDGHTVVAIDGLKVEPLPAGLGGRDVNGSLAPFELVRDIDSLRSELGRRVSAGFGGVAEYGITVRWDKNQLTVIRLLLERRQEFELYGGTRFGGALTTDSAFSLGFDHVALCLGAGSPTVLSIPNALAPGVRQASDFLMALQLTGAAREDSLANLQLRLPIVVVGGGLTAIDTCTEALAYYPVQVEKFLLRYEALCNASDETRVRADWSELERTIADEFLLHARALRAERAAAALEGRPPDLLSLLRRWGGARLAYRRALTASPAYRNHEEVEKALEEGIEFGEDLTPLAVEVDSHGHAAGLRVRLGCSGQEQVIPARSILVAAGTVPNTTVADEDATYRRDGRYFQAIDLHGAPVTPERSAKPAVTQVITRRTDDGRAVTFYGDLHPSYAGNVVTAMASAKNGYPIVSQLLAEQTPRSTPQAIRARLRDGLPATVVRVDRLTHNIVEVVVRAPEAARAFRPGQFFRLQNFDAYALTVRGTRLAMEGLALTGAWVDLELGQIGLIALEMGGSSNLCRNLRPEEPVVLMGPTGEPTAIPSNETVMLAGGGLGNAVLFSIGRAMRDAGCRVLYFAGYRDADDVFRREDIEAAADVVVWCCDRGAAPPPRRDSDRSFVGNIVAAICAYADGSLGSPEIPLEQIDRIVAIGSDRMMAAVAAARKRALLSRFKPDHIALGSINSPMQCMMKGICAQCLQSHRDPVTGEEMVVFSCAHQDQALDSVRFPVLAGRLGQNAVQEKLTARWIESCTAAGAATPRR